MRSARIFYYLKCSSVSKLSFWAVIILILKTTSFNSRRISFLTGILEFLEISWFKSWWLSPLSMIKIKERIFLKSFKLWFKRVISLRRLNLIIHFLWRLFCHPLIDMALLTIILFWNIWNLQFIMILILGWLLH